VARRLQARIRNEGSTTTTFCWIPEKTEARKVFAWSVSSVRSRSSSFIVSSSSFVDWSSSFVVSSSSFVAWSSSYADSSSRFARSRSCSRMRCSVSST
jgi:hypothetical protein